MYWAGTLLALLSVGLTQHPGPAMGPSVQHGWMSARARTAKNLLYVTDNANNVVDIFDAGGHSQHPIGQITDGISSPNGVATDREGDVYVANTNGRVTVYAPGGTTPIRTYTEGLKFPLGVIVDRNDELNVADFSNQDIVEYRKGSTSPSATISFASLEGNTPFGLALDASGDLFVAALGYPNAQAYEIPKGSQKAADLGINSIVVMHGIAVDNQGDVLIADQGNASIDVFPPGATMPSMTITDGIEQPLLIALDKGDKKLFVADAGNSGNGAVRVFAYPSGESADTITFPRFSIPFGVALSPS